MAIAFEKGKGRHRLKKRTLLTKLLDDCRISEEKSKIKSILFYGVNALLSAQSENSFIPISHPNDKIVIQIPPNLPRKKAKKDESFWDGGIGRYDSFAEQEAAKHRSNGLHCFTIKGRQVWAKDKAAAIAKSKKKR